MFLIDKNKFKQFNKAMDKDSDIRFIFYLFDNYPLLKKNLDFRELFNIFESKKTKYSQDVFLMMEAEVVLGEFFLEDIYLNDIISQIKDTKSFNHGIQSLIEEYVQEVIGIKQNKIMYLIGNKNILNLDNYITSKMKFLNISKEFDFESNAFIWGLNFEKNIYLKKMEFVNGI